MSAHLTKEELKRIAPDEYARQFPEKPETPRTVPKNPPRSDRSKPKKTREKNYLPALVALGFALLQFALTWWIIFHF